ncbi:NADH-quinone oxidoreductase subunit E [Phaeovulum sp. W22_SRMD_FR3]|uniref:NADH-quinone oxidoreductase subunit E n=1 Tax=Phaeovulum sp. W22_SRMD_FR3 TaxID=3240274 RepID=UPI003F9A1F94
MLRRLHPVQPESFAFTPANQAWAEAQLTKYPEGRQASGIIPLLWRAQEQEGWLSRPALEYVANMLGMPYIRALEVATFYFMFQLQPVGSVAHIQICGTTSCMICGAEDLMKVCKEKIAANPHEISADGKFSWEEVECLGACANAPMAQIGKDYYEDLTQAGLTALINDMANGYIPRPGSEIGRFSSEPANGATSLTQWVEGRAQNNASVAAAQSIGDGIKRIDGTEVPLRAPWQQGMNHGQGDVDAPMVTEPKPAAGVPVSPTGVTVQEAPVASVAEPEGVMPAVMAEKPVSLLAARDTGADNLKLIKGVGPKLEALLNSMGFYHYDQVAAWSEAELAWVDQNLEGFKGRASRDNWVGQAQQLANGAETEFSARAKKDGIYDAE